MGRWNRASRKNKEETQSRCDFHAKGKIIGFLSSKSVPRNGSKNKQKNHRRKHLQNHGFPWYLTNMNIILRLSSAQLRHAAELHDKIESLNGELERLVGAVTTPTAVPKRRRKMSAAARAKIAAGQRARWARVNGKKFSVKPVKKAKRKVSAAARAKMAAAAKKRWAKAKAAGKSRL
ncbi:MAG TPA: hypothetical protein VMH30_14715 [Verrucomicrobiae bacterium]|nr:hypothetical protein [Verrucomicrobiae bacterium]